MKILNWYVTKSYLTTFVMAIGILSFGMTGAQLMKSIEYFTQGVPLSVAGEFLLYMIPMVLTFTLPWASLVSIMLTFGRMSADNEITAMRACGVSILQIISPIIMASFLFSCLCLYLQLEVAPKMLGKGRALLTYVAVNHPVALFTPGIPVEMDKLSIYIDRKDSDNNIYDIQLYVLDDKNTIRQDITASRGRIEADETTKKLHIILEDAIGTSREGKNRNVHIAGNEARFTLDYGKSLADLRIYQRDKYLTFREVFARSIINKKMGVSTTRLEIELNSRVALALAPIAFMMLGMPLAIRTSRRETSIGLFLSVLLGAIYFGGVMVSDVLRDRAALYPQYLVWLSPVLFQVFGAYYLFRLARK